MAQGVKTSPAVIAAAFRLMAETDLSVAEVARRFDVPASTLRGWRKRSDWGEEAVAEDREAMVKRLRARVERQIASAEAALGVGVGADGAAAAERTARALALLVRTLKELSAYDDERRKRAGQDADELEVDEDEIRQDIARRLEHLRERRGS